jgi:hypothetical protein
MGWRMLDKYCAVGLSNDDMIFVLLLWHREGEERRVGLLLRRQDASKIYERMGNGELSCSRSPRSEQRHSDSGGTDGPKLQTMTEMMESLPIGQFEIV